MSVLLFLVPLSFCLSFLALAFFVWAAKSGQFNDLVTPANVMIVEHEDAAKKADK